MVSIWTRLPKPVLVSSENALTSDGLLLIGQYFPSCPAVGAVTAALISSRLCLICNIIVADVASAWTWSTVRCTARTTTNSSDPLICKTDCVDRAPDTLPNRRATPHPRLSSLFTDVSYILVSDWLRFYSTINLPTPCQSIPKSILIQLPVVRRSSFTTPLLYCRISRNDTGTLNLWRIFDTLVQPSHYYYPNPSWLTIIFEGAT